MTENANSTYDGGGLKGPLYWLAGVVTGKLALNAIQGNGLLGCGAANAAATAANTAVAMELSEARSKISMLEQNAATRNALTDVLYKLDSRVGKLETETPLLHRISDQKIDSVATMATNGIATNSAAIADLANTVAGITKTVVPITSVCPTPMPQYNAWQQPGQTEAVSA